MDRPRRVNGLEAPYTPTQISTWVFLPTLILEFLFFASPLLVLEASIPLSLLVVGLAILSTYYAVMAMKTNPADPRLLLQQHQQQQSQQANGNGHAQNTTTTTTTPCTPQLPTIDPNESTKQCWICDVQVGEKSMHCKFCNKCVDHFDHHCMWLNTCVGRPNYKYFFRTMLSITAMLVCHFAIQLALVVDIFVGTETRQRADDWFQTDGQATIPLAVVMCAFLLFDVVALSLIVQLLLFHVRLQRQNLTTYQFIVKDNQMKREQTKMENELRSKRELAMFQAKADGRRCYMCRLAVGGCCRSLCGLGVCDPLQLPSQQQEDDKTNKTKTQREGYANGGGRGESKEPERHE